MLLRDVDLRAGTRNDSAHRKNQTCDNENETRHMPAKMLLPLRLQQHAVCLSMVNGSTNRGATRAIPIIRAAYGLGGGVGRGLGVVCDLGVGVGLGVDVALAVAVAVGVDVGEPVAVAVGVDVGVEVAVAVAVAVGVEVAVVVAVAVGVGVGVPPPGTRKA